MKIKSKDKVILEKILLILKLDKTKSNANTEKFKKSLKLKPMHRQAFTNLLQMATYPTMVLFGVMSVMTGSGP